MSDPVRSPTGDGKQGTRDHIHEESPTADMKYSRWLTLLAYVLRSMPAGEMGARVLRVLSRFNRIKSVRGRIGPCRLLFDVSDYYQSVMALGHYDQSTLELHRRILRPGDTYIDVGAQLGYMAAHAAECIGPEGTMMLFEPDPIAYSRLCRHLQEARTGPHIKTSNLACSDENADLTLYTAPVLGQSSLYPANPNVARGASLNVETMRLDDIMEKESIGHARLIKIDVEGHEINVLRGLEETLRTGRVDFLIIEKSLATLRMSGARPEHLHTLLMGEKYLGTHLSGEPITQASLYHAELENLLYARNADLLRGVFPAYKVEHPDEGSASDHWDRFHEEATQPGRPMLEAQRIIDEAARGDLKKAIRGANDLLANHSEIDDLRGHMAFWLTLIGESDEARRQYKTLLARNPDDKEARRMLEQIRNKRAD